MAEMQCAGCGAEITDRSRMLEHEGKSFCGSDCPAAPNEYVGYRPRQELQEASPEVEAKLKAGQPLD